MFGLEKELRKFVSNDRDELKDIFIVDEKSVASNGFAMAWVHECIDPDATTFLHSDSVKELIEKHEREKFQPFNMPHLDIKKCSVCGGYGYIYANSCPECKGRGNIIFQSDYNCYDVQCKNCAGAGTLKVLDDSGDTKKPCIQYNCESGLLFDGYIRLDGYDSLIDPRYLFLIKDYPELQIATVPYQDGHGTHRIDMFMFKSSNGINIIIMGAADV